MGAGPGDPGLLTLAGWQLLAEADVVVHDRLGCEELLQALPPATRRIDVGKRPGDGPASQDQINETLLTEARAGNRVVRLKGGDPFVFARGSEERDFLAARGVECRVVPGISSALAVPAAAGIPVTHRELARGFAVWTGRGKDGVLPEPGESDTRIFLMGVEALGDIVARLLARGVAPGTPAALVASGTTYRQQVARAPLSGIQAAVKAAGIKPPAVLVVGETAALGRDSRAGGPRHAQTIMVTSSRVSPLLAARFPHASMLWRPVTAFHPLEGEARAQARIAVADARGADWLLFNNPHSAREFFALLRESGHDARSISARIAAAGEETVEALEALALLPDHLVSGGLGEVFAGQRVAFPCAAHYRGGMAGELVRAGATDVACIAVYRAEAGQPAPVDFAFVDAVFFASPRAVEDFAAIYAEAPLPSLRAIAIGELASAAASRLGFAAVEDLTAHPEPAAQEGIA